MKKIFFVMVLVMSMFLCACNYGERKIEEATEDTAVKIIVTPTTAPAPGTTGQVTTSLEVCGQEGIIILAASYYTAMEEGDTTSLMSLVSSPELIDEDYFNKYENITDVNVKRVYTMEGTGVVDIIAYVYYEVTIDGIETPVPSLDELFISNDNGTFYIYNGKVPTNEYNEVVSLTSAEGVQQLVSSVNREFMNALEADEALKTYMDSIGTNA